MALHDYLDVSASHDGDFPTPPATSATDGVHVEHYALSVLERLEHLPPPLAATHLWPADATCVLQAVSDHWGVYGVGVLGVDIGNGRFNHLELVLDPAWLDRDFRARRARRPWLLATEA